MQMPGVLGVAYRRLITGLLGAVALALAVSSPAGAKEGDIIVGDSSDSVVYRLDPGSGDADVLSDSALFVAPNDSVFSPKGRLYVTDYEAFGGPGGVLSVNPRNGKTVEVAGGAPFEQPDGIAIAPGGDLYVTDLDAEGGALFRVEMPSGEVELVSSVNANGAALEDPVGVVVPPDGKPIVATFVQTIVRVDPQTGEQDPIATELDGLTAGAGLARAADGTLFTTGTAGIEAVDPKSGEVSPVGPLATNGYGIAMDLNGHVLAGNSGTLYDFNPKNGSVDPISSAFNFVEGLEVEPPSCAGRLATIVGSPRPDVLRGSKSADVIAGLGGGDKIRGLDAADRICGGSGRDDIEGGDGGDRISGGGGRDHCSGGKGRDRLKDCE